MKLRNFITTLAKAKYGPSSIHVFNRNDDPDGLREFNCELAEGPSKFNLRYGWWLNNQRYLRVSLGRNGEESDAGIDLNLLGLHWFLRMSHPKLKWLRIDNDYYPRHTEFNIGYVGILSWKLDLPDYISLSKKSKWRDFSLSKHNILGYCDNTKVTIEEGSAVIPMPEGDYPASWTKNLYRKRYRRWPGTLLNKWEDIKFRASDPSISFDMDKEIPVWGKGESAWSCGMDGFHGVSLPWLESLNDATYRVAQNIMAERNRTGFFELPCPMGAMDAQKYLKGE